MLSESVSKQQSHSREQKKKIRKTTIKGTEIVFVIIISNFKIKKNQIKLTRKCIKARCKFNIKKINFVYQNENYASKNGVNQNKNGSKNSLLIRCMIL